MSSRTSSLVFLLLAACGGEARRLHVCGRGDRDDLRADLAGGLLRVEVIDSAGEVTSAEEVSADGPHGIDLSLAGARRVRVTGVTRAGDAVAHGEAPVGGGDACVCLALDPQFPAACDHVLCEVVDDECRFVDDDDGAAVGTRTLELVPVADATSGLRPEGHAKVFEPGLAFVRFDLTVLPRTSVIDRATLRLTIIRPIDSAATHAGGPVSLSGSLAPWEDEAAPPGWAAVDATPLARFFVDEGEPDPALPFAAPVAQWVADPDANLGLAFVGEGMPVEVAARESATPPVLEVAFHLPGDTGAILEPVPACGDGVVLPEAGETCDDGDRVDDDGCTNTCALARCGDGIVRRGVEACDGPGCDPGCVRCTAPGAASTFASEDGHCYAWFDTGARFTDAKRQCDTWNHAIVASFEGDDEQAAVLAGLGLPTTTATRAWIGANDLVVEGDFLWTSATRLSAWRGGPVPMLVDNDCVSVSGRGDWVNDPCETVEARKGYLCEREPWIGGSEGRAYLYVKGTVAAWDIAENDCRNLNAHLASGTAEEERTFLLAQPHFASWTGLTDFDQDDVLAWSNGEAYNGFLAPLGPNGVNRCVRLLAAGFDFHDCSRGATYVCEAR